MSKGFARPGLFRGNEFITVGTLTASATPHTKGTWVQVDASAARDVCGMIFRTTTAVGASGVNTSMLLDVGVGANPNELAVVADIPVGYHANDRAETFLPIHIPAGSRISMRIQAAVVSDTYVPNVNLLFADGRPGSWRGYSIADTIGVNTATSAPTTGDLTDNAWDQAVASTINPYRAITFHPCGFGTAMATAVLLTDVGVGASGFEQVLGTWRPQTTNVEIIIDNTGPPFIEVDIPAGSRLAIRKNGTGDMSGALIGWR